MSGRKRLQHVVYVASGGTRKLGERTFSRLGYRALRLTSPDVTGPHDPHDSALAVLRGVIELGITHIDASNSLGPCVNSQLIREILPVLESLLLATKVGTLCNENTEILSHDAEPSNGYRLPRR